MSRFKYFERSEFKCSETGENLIKDAFIHKLDDLRELCGFAFHITSGYRSPNHSVEAKKANGGGEHTKGHAADIAVTNAAQRYTLLKNAFTMGFTGIGVASTFIHVDTRRSEPKVWTY